MFIETPVQDLYEQEHNETTRVKDQLEAAQKQALADREADRGAVQALHQEQKQILQDVRDQMAKLQTELHTSEVRPLYAAHAKETCRFGCQTNNTLLATKT